MSSKKSARISGNAPDADQQNTSNKQASSANNSHKSNRKTNSSSKRDPADNKSSGQHSIKKTSGEGGVCEADCVGGAGWRMEDPPPNAIRRALLRSEVAVVYQVVSRTEPKERQAYDLAITIRRRALSFADPDVIVDYDSDTPLYCPASAAPHVALGERCEAWIGPLSVVTVTPEDQCKTHFATDAPSIRRIDMNVVRLAPHCRLQLRLKPNNKIYIEGRACVKTAPGCILHLDADCRLKGAPQPPA